MSRSATLEKGQMAAPVAHEDDLLQVMRLAEDYRSGAVDSDTYFASVERLAEHAVDEELAGAEARRKACDDGA